MLTAALISCQLVLPGLIGSTPRAENCSPPPVTKTVKLTVPRTLVTPNLDIPVETGACLVYAQAVFNAPIMYDSAWQSWEATTTKRDKATPIPKEVVSILWFSHQGTYYSFTHGVYAFGNWGHVAVYIPGDGIYTSPASGVGYERYDSIDQIEDNFYSEYVGWSLDINGLQVSEL